MKIRNGFISNSSSSSFIIYGIALPNHTENEGIIETLSTKGEFDIYEPPDDDCIYIGKDLMRIGLDETKRQFQERVEKQFEDLGYKESLTYWQREWYDG